MPAEGISTVYGTSDEIVSGIESILQAKYAGDFESVRGVFGHRIFATGGDGSDTNVLQGYLKLAPETDEQSKELAHCDDLVKRILPAMTDDSLYIPPHYKWDWETTYCRGPRVHLDCEKLGRSLSGKEVTSIIQSALRRSMNEKRAPHARYTYLVGPGLPADTEAADDLEQDAKLVYLSFDGQGKLHKGHRAEICDTVRLHGSRPTASTGQWSTSASR